MKLEDIHKENIHKVPEGYFDELPSIIQAGVQKEKDKKPFWYIFKQPAVSYVIPALTIIVIMVYVFVLKPFQNQTSSDQLASVSTEDLIAYVELSEITTEDILDQIDLSTINVDDLLEDNTRFINEEEISDEDLENYLHQLEVDDFIR